MKKAKTVIKAEKREQKNRKRMHLSGGSLRKPSKYAGMSLVKKKSKASSLSLHNK